MKYHPPSNHIYYEDSDIPINKKEIKDAQVIHELERSLLLQSYEYFHTTLNEEIQFNEEYFKEIHRHLFSNLYDWAGVYRNVNISKGDSMFCPSMYLDSFSKEIFEKLAGDNYLRDYEDISKKILFAKKLAFYTCELLVLHPFNEGNGRSLRLFIDMIATYNGYDYIDYDESLNDEAYILASIECMQTNCDLMEKIIFQGLQKASS